MITRAISPAAQLRGILRAKNCSADSDSSIGHLRAVTSINPFGHKNDLDSDYISVMSKHSSKSKNALCDEVTKL